MLEDDKGLYHNKLIDGHIVKIYLTREELDNYRNSQNLPIIIIDTCLEAEAKGLEAKN